MKVFLPWVLVVALCGGIYFLFTQVKKGDAKIAELNEQNLALAQVRAENEELKKIPLQMAELERLRKEHDELIRLRGENQRVREQVKQLNAQLASAHAESAKAQEAQQRAAQLANQNPAVRTQEQQLSSEAKVAAEQQAACINNLRQIDGAKQQWALENKKTADAVPTPEDLAPYLQNINQVACPAGGTYTINAVGVPPTCSVPSHTISK